MSSTNTLGRLHRLCTRQFPSTGGELAGTEPTRPPRQAELDTPPQEGNWLVQNSHDHPVKRSLTPLHRRGIAGTEEGN